MVTMSVEEFLQRKYHRSRLSAIAPAEPAVPVREMTPAEARQPRRAVLSPLRMLAHAETQAARWSGDAMTLHRGLRMLSQQ